MILDVSIVAFYFLVTMLLALRFILNRSKTAEAFIGANGSYSKWSIGISLSATYLSTIAIISFTNRVFLGNLLVSVVVWAVPIAAWIGIKYFMPTYMKEKYFSSYSHLGQQFGNWAAIYAGIWSILIQIAWVSIILISLEKLIYPIVGIEWTWITLFVVGASTLYTYFGGFRAVVVTDVLQWVIILFGVTAILTFILVQVGGISEVLAVAKTHEKLDCGSLNLDLSTPSLFVVFIFGFALNLQNFGIDQAFTQRCVVLRSSKQSSFAVWIAAGSYLLIISLLLLIGLSLFAYYSKNHSNLELNGIPVLSHFIAHEAPAGIKGLAIIVMLAAAMSSIDSGINGSAVVFLENIYRIFSDRPSPEQRLKALNYSSLACGILMAFFTFLFKSLGSDIGYLWLEIESVLSSSILGLFLLKLFVPKSSMPEGIVGTIFGVLFGAWVSFSSVIPDSLSFLKSPFHSFMSIILGSIACVVFGALTLGIRTKLRKKL